MPGSDVASVGSNAANSLRPLDWRAITAEAVYPLPVAVGVDCAQGAPEQPLTYPTRTRPSLSTVMSKKSSRLRPMFAPPFVQMFPRCIGAFGVASLVVHVLPPSNVWAI